MFNSPEINSLINSSKDIRILYCEDEEGIRESVLKLLNIIFTNIHVACNGKEGLEIFKKTPIDFILTDINMPIMNGLELIQEIKKINAEIPSLIISAQTDQNNMVNAIKCGIDGFILKPIQPDQFFESLYKATQKAILIKENKKNLMILKQYQEITNKSSIISKTDPRGIITYVNENFCDISGYSKEELIGKSHNVVRHPDNPKEVFEKLWYTIKVKKDPWSGVIKNLSKEGKSYFVKSTIKPLLDQDGNIIEYIALRNDITEIMSEKKQLLSSLDTYNESFMALIQIENFEILDKFYNISTIEKIESIYEDALINLFPKHSKLFEKIYRLGDGLFAITNDYKNIIRHNINIKDELLTLIKNTKESTIKLENIEYDVSIVVSYCYGDKDIYDNTRYGLEQAITTNKSLIFANNFFEEAQKTAQKNIETIHMVKKALDNYNIVSYFQPIIRNGTKEIIKYESLVRLINEDGETITPYHFLDASKKGTYYTKITNRVIESSFNILDHIEHNVSINLSVIDIENDAIRNKIFELVARPSYKGRVTFELLEDEDIKDIRTVRDFISKVKKIGDVKIAIDDFGSGYSNFERLLDYNPDILKIDGSLIKNIETNMFSRNIVETIVTFAQKQNIETIAEFVENENIYNILNEMGITYSQGYYFGKPEKLI